MRPVLAPSGAGEWGEIGEMRARSAGDGRQYAGKRREGTVTDVNDARRWRALG